MRTHAVDTAALEERIAELERERELLNAIANYAPSLICLVDPDGRVRPTATNRAFETTLGYRPGESGGDLFWEKYVHPDDAADARAAIDATVRGEVPQERDARWLTNDGRTVEVAWSCIALPPIATGPVYLISGTDITERKRHEEEVRESRARLVTASLEARKRLERNLHDGAQQRLIVLLLSLRFLHSQISNETHRGLLGTGIEELSAAISELRELAQGVHPALLTKHGLTRAVAAAAERTPVPVELEVADGRFEEAVEAAAYYVVSESLTNVVKYADATRVRVRVAEEARSLVVVVADDGCGGANPDGGTGLRGLADRVSALDGTFEVASPAGGGTTIRAAIPLP